MKKFLLSFLLLLAAVPLWAHDFEVDGIYYLDQYNNTVIVTYAGSSYSAIKGEYTGSVVIPKSVTYKGIIYSVISIGDEAFRGCTGLTSVTIPNSVTSIDARAFYGCSGLTSVTIPNSVTSIDAGAFSGCSGLTSVTIPNSVTSIGGSAFNNCTELTEVHISDLSAWCKIGFENDLANPFCYAKKLYLNGSEITDLVIPNDITEIKKYAFYGCSGLTSLVIPNSVTEIGYMAFNECTSITDLVIEDGANILTLGTALSWMEDYQLGQGQFYYCPLKTVYVGRNLSYYVGKNYGYSPFYKKTSLKAITIGDSVTYIGDRMFIGCDNIITAKIGANVRVIHSSSFSGCVSLKNVYSSNTIPPKVDGIVFEDKTYQEGTLYVPKGYADVYANTDGWKEFLFVEELVFTPTQSISINSDLSTVYVGEEFTIPVIITPEDCSTKKLLWTSSDENVLAVDENGVITAKSRGSATITVATTDGTNLSASKDFKVSVLNLSSMGLHFNVLSSKEKTVEVTSIARNEATDTTYYYTGSIYIPSEVNVRGENYKVVAIGNNAFDSSSGLTSVTIPNSVTSIGNNAFIYCSGLTSIVLPDSVETIGNSAFHNCSKLTSIEFGKYLSSLGNNILANCSELKTVKVNSPTPATAQEYTFNAIPTSAILYVPLASDIEKYSNAIGWNKFTSIQASKKLVESITLNKSSLNLVVGEQFQLNATITPSDATNINIIWSSSNTAVATISNSGIVTAIGEGTASITATTTDETNIVAECTIKVEKKKVVNNIYYNLSLDNKTATVTYAGNTAIEENDEYSGSIVIPESINHNDITYTITEIGDSAFKYCISLTEIVIPKSVNSIESKAFTGCRNLSKVISNNETPPTTEANSFDDLPSNVILYVPNKNAMNLYREATGWNTFTKMRVVDVVDFEPGDANCDKSLSVTDVVMLANAIMGENSNEFNEFAADANCDGVISVSDIVCTATVIMSGTELANTSQASIIPFNVPKTSLSVNEVAIARGETKQINIKLNNAIDFTAFQVDLELPNGLTIENSSLSLQVNSSHILYANEIEENVHRFMSFSMTNEKLNCDNELLLTIDVVANDDFIGGMLNLNNILLVNREGKEFMLKNISSIISSTNSISNTIYNNVNIYAQGKNIVIENTDVENAYIYTIDGAIKIEQLQPGYNVIEMNKMGMYIVTVGDKTDKVLIY